MASCNPTADAAAHAKAEPSWGRVLATTIKLATSRRLRPAGFGPPATARRRGRNWSRWVRGHLYQLAAGHGDGTGRLAAALAMVRAQALPYLPAHAVIGHLADGQAALTIEFAAPSPLGLLTPVLEADLQLVPARTANRWCVPLGRAQSDER